MSTWTSEKWLAGPPEEVLALLTEPDAIARWAPIGFDLVDHEHERLTSGTRTRVGGFLAGRRVELDVEVLEAEGGRLALVASGPISIDVEYLLAPVDEGSCVHASVSVAGRGLRGRLLAQATDVVLAAGALDMAIGRLGRELETLPVAA
ncbi:MAG: SRPBCC family protein [Solirubrobacteraceae bacterium]